MTEEEVIHEERWFRTTVAHIKSMSTKNQKLAKNVVLELTVDSKWKWIARQPYGQYCLYTHKPRIHRAVEDTADDGFVPTYWVQQKGEETELLVECPQGGDWQKSLKRI